MNILIVNTSENAGGAAVAASRLMCALNQSGEHATMLVRDKDTDNPNVVALNNKWLQRWRFLWERLYIYIRCRLSRRHLFDIDVANTGADITSLKVFKEADVIHLHWINQGMLSLDGIRKILNSGKPVVWTMHDIWPATAICHITHGCSNFKSVCRECQYMCGNSGYSDLAHAVWQRKQRMLQGQHLHFVACSRWLAGEARKSALLRGQTVASIPNPIDTTLFCKSSTEDARKRLGLPLDKRVILFVAQRATNVNKGMAYLIDACKMLAQEYPDMREKICVAVLGGHAGEVMDEIPFPAYPLGYTSDTARIIDVYNASDVFVLPSLSENLPNTIMEAMACGVPCIGFNVGGIPEMIDHHKNGYVARFRDSADLAKGIRWILFDADYDVLSKCARRKIVDSYSLQSVAMRYVEVYNHAIAIKHYKL